VLALKYVNGTYLIDAEHTKGFAPASRSKTADPPVKPKAVKPAKPAKHGKHGHGHHGG
jgi:hypothetical protein